VSLLNRVDFPTFGCPSSATVLLIFERHSELLHHRRILEPVFRCRDRRFKNTFRPVRLSISLNALPYDQFHDPGLRAHDDAEMTFLRHQNFSVDFQKPGRHFLKTQNSHRLFRMELPGANTSKHFSRMISAQSSRSVAGREHFLVVNRSRGFGHHLHERFENRRHEAFQTASKRRTADDLNTFAFHSRRRNLRAMKKRQIRLLITINHGLRDVFRERHDFFELLEIGLVDIHTATIASDFATTSFASSTRNRLRPFSGLQESGPHRQKRSALSSRQRCRGCAAAWSAAWAKRSTPFHRPVDDQ